MDINQIRKIHSVRTEDNSDAYDSNFTLFSDQEDNKNSTDGVQLYVISLSVTCDRSVVLSTNKTDRQVRWQSINANLVISYHKIAISYHMYF